MATSPEGEGAAPDGGSLEGSFEVSLGDGNWEAVEVSRGSIISVDLSGTSESFPPGLHALFVVLQVSVSVDRTMIAEVRSLGTGNKEMDGNFSSRFNRRGGRLHFCASKPCTEAEVENVLHITKVRVWTVSWEICPVLTAIQRRAVKKFLAVSGPEEEEEPEEGSKDREMDPTVKPKGSRAPARVPGRSKGFVPLKRPSGAFRGSRKASGDPEKEKKKKERKKEPGKEELTESSRKRLEASLAALKAKMTGMPGRSAAKPAEPIEDGSSESAVPVDSASDPEELRTGTSLRGKGAEEPRKKKDRKKVKEADGAVKRTAAMRALEASSGGIARGTQSQLVQQALVISSGEKKEKKSRSEKLSLALARILTKTLRSKKDQKEKDKKDKKKRAKKKKRQGHGSDPSSSDGETGILQQELLEVARRWEGQINRFGGRVGSPPEEEGEVETRFSLGHVGRSRQGAVGSVVYGGDTRGREFQSHGRCEADLLLPDLAKGEVGRCNAPAAGDVSSSSLHGPVEARPVVGSGGRFSGEIPLPAPECAGRELDGGPSYGAVPAGGIFRCGSFHYPEDSEACKVGSKSTRLRHQWTRERLWPWKRRQRQIRLLESRRRRSEGKEGQERKRKRTQQRWLVERESWQRRRLEGAAGDQGRPIDCGAEEGKLSDALECEWYASDSRFLRPATGLRSALAGCTSVRAAGVALCWMLVAGAFYRGAEEILLKFFGELGKDLAVRHPTSRVKITSGVFPIREGKLFHVRLFLAENSLDAILEDEECIETLAEDAWVYLCIFAVNSLAGYPAAPGVGRWSRAGEAAATAMRESVRRRLSTDVRVHPDVEGMEDDLKTKQVNYVGEEIPKCHALTLSQIIPALPPVSHGGSIDALDWLGPRSKEFLLHPDRCLLPEDSYELPRLPGKVHIEPGEKLKVAQELVSRNICRWIDLEEVHVIKGKRLLNGLFGVAKNTKLPDQRPILRVIMNLVPSNMTTHQLRGAVDKLPAITAWQSLVLDGDETLAMWQSDMSSAFYLFKIPEQWGKFLAFNIVVDGKLVGCDGSEKVALCSNVIPMGWASSVGLMQEMAEALVYAGGLHPQHQVRKGSPLPSWMSQSLKLAEETDRMWWHVYLDNFCAGERLHPSNLIPTSKGRSAIDSQSWLGQQPVCSRRKRKGKWLYRLWKS